MISKRTLLLLLMSMSILEPLHGMKKAFSVALNQCRRLSPAAFKNALQSSIVTPKQATVEPATISIQEHHLVQHRARVNKQAYEQYFNRHLTEDELPRIGLIGSGGGYRALFLTLGYYMAAHEIGLLDICSYMSGLSGSTWLMGPWIYSQKPIHVFYDFVLNRIRNKAFSMKEAAYNLSMTSLLNENLYPKILMKQPISSVDIYGALLEQALMSPGSPNTLSAQQHLLQSGAYPFPLYTAISMNHAGLNPSYDWYEFNPIAITNLSLKRSIPAYAFNWQFKAGSSVEPAPEQHFGYLMGIFGSAYAANVKDALSIVTHRLQRKDEALCPIPENYYQTIFSFLSHLQKIPGFNVFRLSPARINNPFKDDTNSTVLALAQKKYLTMIDAGIDYNLAGLPLLRPERHVKACIVLDASRPYMMDHSLRKLLQHAHQQYGYTYQRVDDNSSHTLRIFKDSANKGPLLIYLNFLKDEKLFHEATENPALQPLLQRYDLAHFDPVECVERGFCNTANFNYTADQCEQLCAWAQLCLKIHAAPIKQMLQKHCYPASKL